MRKQKRLYIEPPILRPDCQTDVYAHPIVSHWPQQRKRLKRS